MKNRLSSEWQTDKACVRSFFFFLFQVMFAMTKVTASTENSADTKADAAE